LPEGQVVVSFANAGFAPWLLLIALPLVIHLLTRQAIRTCALPTFRFLQRSIARQSRLFRLRHLLLLLLRTALAALLVIVFLKPVRIAPLAAAGEGRRSVVIVLDVSLSMGCRAGGVTSLQRAQAQALRVLDGLQGGDRANVLLAGAAPTAVLSQPAADLGTLRQAVRSASPTQARCDVPAAVALAAEQLNRAAAGRRELYFVSDFQRTNWADVKLDAVPAGTQVVFVGTEENERDNFAVTGIRLRPEVPRAGEEVTALVEVWNGSGQMRPLPVTFRAGTALPQTQTVTVPPYATGTAAFALTPPSQGGGNTNASASQGRNAPDSPPYEGGAGGGGRYVCEAILPSDNLPDDNTRHLAVDIGRPLDVCLLTDENPNASPSGSYFVSRALNPAPDRPGVIRVLPKRPTELTAADLRAADAVVLCNASAIPADRLSALLRYVQGGGSLLVFLYGGHARAQMEALDRLAGRGEGLPFLPTEWMDVRNKGRGYVQLGEGRYESRLLRIFKNPADADLGQIRFFRFFLTTEPDGRAEVLLKFDDGTPAAARRPLGAGSVLLCNFSPVPADSDLARQQVFPPLLHEFLKGMTRREGRQRAFFAGGAASATIPPTKGRVTVTTPEGESRPVTVDRTGGGVVLERVEKTGLYTVMADGQEAAVIAVNTDPDESDLRTIDPRELQNERDRRPVYLVGGARGDTRLEDLSKSRPLWPWFLLAAFAVLVAEQWVAGLGARRGAKARGIS
jgi:hypothetical protein